MFTSASGDFTDWLCEIHTQRVGKEINSAQRIAKRAAELALEKGWSRCRCVVVPDYPERVDPNDPESKGPEEGRHPPSIMKQAKKIARRRWRYLTQIAKGERHPFIWNGHQVDWGLLEQQEFWPIEVHLKTATLELNPQWAAPLNQACIQKHLLGDPKTTLWEYTVAQIIRYGIVANEEQIAAYAEGLCKNEITGATPLSVCMGQLDQDIAFKTSFLQGVWMNCSDEAEEIGLPTLEVPEFLTLGKAAELFAILTDTKKDKKRIRKEIREEKIEADSNGNPTEGAVARRAAEILSKRKNPKTKQEDLPNQNWKHTCPECQQKASSLIGATKICRDCFFKFYSRQG